MLQGKNGDGTLRKSDDSRVNFGDCSKKQMDGKNSTPYRIIL